MYPSNKASFTFCLEIYDLNVKLVNWPFNPLCTSVPDQQQSHELLLAAVHCMTYVTGTLEITIQDCAVVRTCIHKLWT
jgi:hypothetical protein